MNDHWPPERRVAIVGGGLAGLAAALRLSEHGCRVTVFEARRQLGGRAASFRDPASAELIDYCQHVSMGCCTNFADFTWRTGISDQFERFTALNIFAADGKKYGLSAAPLLPAPFHLLPSFLRLGYLSWSDRFQTVRLLLQIAKTRTKSDLPLQRAACGTSQHRLQSETMQQWLAARNVSMAALEGFWNVILVSALGETVDRLSVDAARKVLVDGFMANRRAYDMLVPIRPLSELIDQRVGVELARRGVEIARGHSVQCIDQADTTGFRVVAADAEFVADAVVLATSWRHTRQLLCSQLAARTSELPRSEEIASAPITGVHLWFDRPITDFRHAILIGRLSQWLFARTEASGDVTSSPMNSYYYQVVISGSHNLTGRSHDDVVAEVQSGKKKRRADP